MLDSHTLVSNAVGAVCFAAAYTVSKTLSRAEAFSDNDDAQDEGWSEDDGSTTDDTDAASSSAGRDTPAPKQHAAADPDTLFRLRTHLSLTHRMPAPPLRQELQTQTHRIPAPPLRLPFQELQGDLPLYFDPHTLSWTWLEPFPLDNPEEEARLAREAALRRAHWRTSTPPRARKVGVERREERAKVLWTREEGTTTFVRGGGVLMRVELPEGEYFPLVDVQGIPFFGLGPPSADATYLTTRGWVPVPPLPVADAAPPLTPSPSNNRKRKGVHFPNEGPISSIRLVERLEYKVPRTRTDGDVRAALRRARRALEELEDLLLVPDDDGDVQEREEDPFAFTYAREALERVNAREAQDRANGYEDQERVHARREQEQANAHADLHTPTKPAPAAAAATRAPLQLLTPSSLERPAPYRLTSASSASHRASSDAHSVPSDAHRAAASSYPHRVPSASHRSAASPAFHWHRASSAPPELYSPTPAPRVSTPALSGLREDSPTPAARRMNGRHMVE